jgi:hypothetical protein
VLKNIGDEVNLGKKGQYNKMVLKAVPTPHLLMLKIILIGSPDFNGI